MVIGRETMVMVGLNGKAHLVCDFCHFKGHTRETCYKLHGYPKRKGITSNSYANNATGSNQGNEVRAFDNHASSTNTTPTGTHGGVSLFTPEQYSQILQMLNKVKDIESTTANVATTSTAGMITAFMSDVVNRNWIIDTGASNHMVHNASLMTQYRNLDDKSNMHVNLPTGSQASISHIGESLVLTDKTVNGVLFIPEFKYNLLSVSQLTKQLKCAVIFFPDFCVFQDLSNGKVLGIGREDQGLYLLQTGLDTSADIGGFQAHNSTTEVSNNTKSKVTNVRCNSLCDLWHKRLGHAPLKVLSRIKCLHSISLEDHHCTVCPLAKQSRLPFPVSVTTSAASFDIVHGDVWGPYRVSNHDGKRYFLTLVDDKSRYTWISLLHTKSDCLIVLKDFISMVKTQFGVNVKCIRTDNGTEFVNSQVSSLFKECGIIHQSSCVYTPQQNGIVERKHRSILDMARALRFQASIPLKYWGCCVSTAVYILNRLPSVVLQNEFLLKYCLVKFLLFNI